MSTPNSLHPDLVKLKIKMAYARRPDLVGMSEEELLIAAIDEDEVASNCGVLDPAYLHFSQESSFCLNLAELLAAERAHSNK